MVAARSLADDDVGDHGGDHNGDGDDESVENDD